MNLYEERDKQRALRILRTLLPRWAWPLLDLVTK